MLRMEIALLLVLAFVASMYFRKGRKHTKLHRTFAILLILVMIHLCFDAATVYTVYHVERVPLMLNDILHRFFVGSMVAVLFMFYRYISILVTQEKGQREKMDILVYFFGTIAMAGSVFLPIRYIQTPQGNYTGGGYEIVCYGSVLIFLICCTILVVLNWKQLYHKQKIAIGAAFAVECIVCILQGLHPTWLISGMGITLMTLAFYLTLENPDMLQAELTEQKISMLYLKSQVNPHFLYNTLDTIRIQAELNGDKKVAVLLMRLVEFFRLSVKVDQTMVTLDDEIELLEAYMELMCYRYPKLQCEYDIDPDLGDQQVPNFILQPMVENSLLHGLKNKGYQGKVMITAKKVKIGMEICIVDSGSGFLEGKKAVVEEMLLHYNRQEANLEGNSIGILNVQKRIKLLCGREYGLRYTENETGGVTVHILLPVKGDCE